MTSWTSHRLATRIVEKPWGRKAVPTAFNNAPFPKRPHKAIGEICFESDTLYDLPLLVKYIFTSAPLSVQVHPNDAQAIPYGLSSGKTECWLVLDCEPDSTLGIGFKKPLTETEMLAAIEDGTLADHLDWKPVKPGDFFLIPAGTVHAIGAHIILVEVQQNADATYRLYDYGSDRELHLEAGIAVSHLHPYPLDKIKVGSQDTMALVDCPTMPFWVKCALWSAGETLMLEEDDQQWFVPLDGTGTVDGKAWQAGECWLVKPDSVIKAHGNARALLVGTTKPTVSAPATLAPAFRHQDSPARPQPAIHAPVV